MALSKSDILSSQDLPKEELPVPEWGGTVFVRTMTGTERDAFEVSIAGSGESKNLLNLRARLAGLCLCDEKGERLFTDAEIMELGKKSSKALDRVFDVARRLNALNEKDVEELAKN